MTTGSPPAAIWWRAGEKALLIDTGMGEGDLAGLVSQLTDLPVEVAVTHPHLDHMHWIDKFSRVYLHKEDIAPLKEHPESYPSALSHPGASLPELMPIEEGSVIDLGAASRWRCGSCPGTRPTRWCLRTPSTSACSPGTPSAPDTSCC